MSRFYERFEAVADTIALASLLVGLACPRGVIRLQC